MQPGRPSLGRVQMLVALSLAVALAACGGDAGTGARAHAELARAPAPVVLVVVDTLRADRLGAYGHDRPTSPTLDALAAEGLLFERAFAQSTWTKPTTASILTGLYPSEHGVMQTVSRLEPRFTTLAERLADEGYPTAAFVANGFVANRAFGYAQGFDHFEGEALETRAGDLYARADHVVDRALAWLDAAPAVAAGEPFLLYVHVVDPHMPYDPPAPFRERFVRPYDGPVTGHFGSKRQPGEAADLSPADRRHLLDLYDAEIAFTDAQLARLFDGLRAHDAWEQALVVVLSDHGEEFGEHGGLQHGPGMYQEVVHVPLLVKPPAGRGLPRGLRYDGVAMQVDVLPTVLDLLGLPAEDGLPGTSLVERVLLGSDRVPAVAYGEVEKQRVLRAMAVEGHLKLVRQVEPEPLELHFDLGRDPAETDPHGVPAGLRGRLRARLDAYANASSRASGFTLVAVNDGDETRELHLRLGTAAGPLAGLSVIDLELQPAAGPGQDRPVDRVVETWGDEELHVTRLILRVAPGDRDGLQVFPGPGDDRVHVDVRAAEGPLPLAALRVGPSAAAAREHPLVLDREDPALVGADPTRAAVPGDAGLRVHLWRARGLRAGTGRFDAAQRRALEDLGYFGDDED